MKGLSLTALLLAPLVMLSSIVGDAAEPAPQAETLLRWALQADESADHALRDQLLHKALQLDPEYQLARWYLGEVEYDGRWKSVDDVAKFVSSNPSWEEYKGLLSEAGSDPQSQAELARWCETQGLTYEAKWHWVLVLQAAPDDREALAKLGVRWYEGMLLTDSEIKQFQQQEKETEADYKRYSKQFEGWLREAAVGTEVDRADAVRKVNEVREPAAMPALMDAAFYNPKTEKLVRDKLRDDTDHFFQQLRLAVVTSLSEISDHNATLTLVQLAVDWPNTKVATAAAKTLQYRDKIHYVPLLMGQLASPLELTTSTRVLPNGKITVSHDISEVGPLARKELKRSSQFYTHKEFYRLRGNSASGPEGLATYYPRNSSYPLYSRHGYAYGDSNWAYFTRVDHAKDLRNAFAETIGTEQRVLSENANRISRNKRVEYVLGIAMGEDYGQEPTAWWDAWKQYNELYTPEELPVEETLQRFDYSTYETDVRTCSCFVFGTPVWTEAGTVPIERLQIGDMVLSQDPATGELDYRPVIQTTVRPPSATVKLGIGDENIVATRGHRFWVTGKGWNMAKFLKPGEQLWSLAGEVNLDRAEPAKEYEAYNLEVGQFHTYFVGNNKLLVHDNTCPLPIVRSLPGMEDTP